MTPKKHRETRTEAFKRETVRQFELRGERTGDEVASSLGVVTSQLYDWRLRYGSQIASTSAESPEMELRRLRRELKQVREERDILKGSSGDRVGDLRAFSDDWEHAGEDFQPQVFLIA